MDPEVKQPIYLLIGVPGTGKSWVAERAGDAYQLVEHDAHIGAEDHNAEYVDAILKAWESSKKPLLAEAPFSISQIKEPLERAGARVIPVILYEDRHTLAERYEKDPKRSGKPIPKGHLSRMETFRRRQSEYNAFMGNSSEVLEYLKQQVAEKREPYRNVP